MRFVVAGGGFAGLATALAVARAGHSAVVLERDVVAPSDLPDTAFEVPRRGIPHFLQPHAFLPRGRRELARMAPDVLDALLEVGAEPQDLAEKLQGPRRPDDDDLVYLWVRRPVIEWALRRAVAAESAVELHAGVTIAGLLTSDDPKPRAVGVATADGAEHRGDVVVDALGRYRVPAGWPRADGDPTEGGVLYFCRYFELAAGAEHLDWPLLNPRGDIGYMGFNVFRGDNRTYAVIFLVPAADRQLRVLKDERAWMAACAAMTPLAQITARDHGRPITDVLPMGNLVNVERTGDPGVAGVVAVGDALCHTDPAFSYGLAFALAHAQALAAAADDAPTVEELGERYLQIVGPEARERHALVCAMDDARVRRWGGEALDVGRHDGCYPLFSFNAALAAAPHDDDVLRRAIGRVGLLDRTAVFDDDSELHDRIESIFARVSAQPPPVSGPPRDELLARIQTTAA